MADSKDWRQLLKKANEKARKVTKLKNVENFNWDYTNHPNYNTFAINPSQKLDVGKNYLISGSESSIMMQASLIKALHDILGNRLGFVIDFEKWFDDFSYEFKVDPITGKWREGLVNNPNDQAAVNKITLWGGNKATRPRFKWYEPKDINKYGDEDNTKFLNETGYYVIQFWRDRSKETEIDFIAGSLVDIRSQLCQLMRTVSSESIDLGERGISESKLLTGFPEIKIKFWQTKPIENDHTEENKAKNKIRYDTELSISLIGYGETVEENQAKLLEISDLKLFKTKIEQLFYPDGKPFILKRGRDTYTYQDWGKGYANYTHFNNEQNAIDLYSRLVQIKGDTFDSLKVSCSKKFDKNNFTEKNITVLTEQKKARNYRPIVDLEFWQAWVWLPKSQQKIVLVSRGRSPIDNRLI